MAEKSLEAHFIKCLKEGNTKKALYIVELLGDKVNGLYRGKSPLLWAKEFENDEVASVLEERGAVEEVISDEEAEKLGLELVEKTRDGDLEAVINLIEKGADVNLKDRCSMTALIWASQNGHLEIVEKLIEAGADVNAKDRSNNTALIRVSVSGYLEIVEKLIEANADVNETDSRGYTALMMASCNGRLEVVETLIEKGADVNQKTDYGLTALMFASEFGNLEVVEALLDAGADVSIKNKYGNTAMSLAKNEETRRVIIEAVKKKNEKANDKEPSFMDRVKGLFGKGE